MRSRSPVILAIFALAASLNLSIAVDGADEAVTKEFAALKGTWRLVSIEDDGRKAADEAVRGHTAHFDGTAHVVVRRGDLVRLESDWTVDLTKKPKHVTSLYTAGENKGKTRLGIYELVGDTLTLCLADFGKERPTEFSSKPGTGNILIFHNRDKK